LTIGQVRLNTKMPHIILKAKDEKARRGATMPLHSDLVPLLKEWIEFRTKEEKAGPKDKLFMVPKDLCTILTLDLAFAGIDKRDALDHVVDVHALRHTHATWLAAAGVPITVVQASMRHANISTTAKYMHTKTEAVADGLHQLPNLMKNNDDEEDNSSAAVCV
jgi:integrase